MEPENTDNTTEKKNKEGVYPKPPEEDFYGGNARPTALSRWIGVLKSNRIRYVLLTLGFIMAILFFASLRTGRNNHLTDADKKEHPPKPVYTAAEMDRAISASGNPVKKKSQGKSKRTGTKERKLATDIAVFIDEGGDFNFSPSGTRVYAISAVITHNPWELLDEMSALKHRILSGELHPHLNQDYLEKCLCHRFHASEDKL